TAPPAEPGGWPPSWRTASGTRNSRSDRSDAASSDTEKIFPSRSEPSTLVHGPRAGPPPARALRRLGRVFHAAGGGQGRQTWWRDRPVSGGDQRPGGPGPPRDGKARRTSP